MQYFLIMEVMNGEGLSYYKEYCLGNPVQYLGFRIILPFFLCASCLRIHIASFTVGHDNTEVSILIGKRIFVTDNIGMPKFLQQLKLIFNIFSFLLF